MQYERANFKVIERLEIGDLNSDLAALDCPGHRSPAIFNVIKPDGAIAIAYLHLGVCCLPAAPQEA